MRPKRGMDERAGDSIRRGRRRKREGRGTSLRAGKFAFLPGRLPVSLDKFLGQFFSSPQPYAGRRVRLVRNSVGQASFRWISPAPRIRTVALLLPPATPRIWRGRKRERRRRHFHVISVCEAAKEKVVRNLARIVIWTFVCVTENENIIENEKEEIRRLI